MSLWDVVTGSFRNSPLKFLIIPSNLTGLFHFFVSIFCVGGSCLTDDTQLISEKGFSKVRNNILTESRAQVLVFVLERGVGVWSVILSYLLRGESRGRFRRRRSLGVLGVPEETLC